MEACYDCQSLTSGHCWKHPIITTDRRCENGHLVVNYEEYCNECGEKL